MTDVLDLSPARSQPVLDLVRSADFAAQVASRDERDEASVARAVADIASEAELALELLRSAGPLPRATRILEVGAGAGVVAGILHAAGAQLVAIEPLIGGFDLFAAVRAELAARVPMAAATIDRRTALELDPARDGRFDLVFSVNVLEHVKPLDASLDALARVLAPGGRMLHTCPNYRVPYEPHFAMPLVPLVPTATARLVPGLGDDPLWQSLNFITAGDLARFAERAGLTLELRRGVLADAVQRLAHDPAFARRQGWAGRVAAALGRVGAVRVLRAIPSSWLSPMVAELRAPTATTPHTRASTPRAG